MKKKILIPCFLHFALCICNAQSPGSLDTTFGIGGEVSTGFGGMYEEAKAIAIQSDGKIVVAGWSGYEEPRIGVFAIARYNSSNGSLDNSFGSGGRVNTRFIDENFYYGHSVAMQSDGKIVVAGHRSDTLTNTYYTFAVARYNSNGSLENVWCNLIGQAHSVAIQSDGKIVVAGTSGSRIALLRFNSNNSYDTTFGSHGIVTTAVESSNCEGYSVAIQSDGKIVVAGGKSDFVVVRYNSDGSLDNTFSSGGIVTTDFGSSTDVAKSVAIQSDGKILVAGSLGGYNTGVNAVVALARYNNNGSLDNTFGTGGKVTTPYGVGISGNSVAIQSDGKIVVAGSKESTTEQFPGSSFAAVMYNSNGSLDNTFGTGGITTTHIYVADIGLSTAIQSDGKILVAGSTGYTNGIFWEVVRYNGSACVTPIAPTGSSKTICSGSTATLSATGSGTLGWYSQATSGTYLGGGANYITPILNTTTTYYVQDSTCAASSQRKAVLVTVNPLPTVTANASATNICEGTTVILTGGGATSYTWSDGISDGQGFVPTTTTTYKVTGTDGNNCSNMATKTINVNPLPIVTANASSLNVCEGTSVTLTGGGASSYVWTEGITNGQGFIPAITTTYTVTGTDENNCSNTATKIISVIPLPIVTANASATNVCEGTSVTLTAEGASSYLWTGGITNGQDFIPAITTTYTVTGTDENNCSNTATKIISVNPLPIVTANASAINVCEGSSIVLTGEGASSYTWSDGISDGQGFIPATTTTYIVTGTDGNNCSNTATKTITVNPLPDVSTALSGITISANQTGATYQWLNCNNGNSAIAGATDQSYTALINGEYSVMVVMNGCADTSTCVNLNITGLNKIVENTNQLIVFPNPNNGTLIIQSTSEGDYSIRTELGQTVQLFKLSSANNYTVNIENLSIGIYFIVGFNKNQMTNQRVVVTK